MTKINFSIPKYQNVGEALIKAIMDKTWQVGDFLPTEKRICQEYNISRFTAREALKYVENAGLIKRRQGSGSKVVRLDMPEQVDHYANSIQDLLSFGQRTRFIIEDINQITVQNSVAKATNIPLGTSCTELSGLRFEPHNDVPLCFSTLYRANQKDAISKGLKSKDTAMFAIIKALDASKVGSIEQDVNACLIPQHLAKKLNVDVGSAGLKITRRYFATSNKGLILASESIYPGERVTVKVLMLPDQ